MEHTMIVLNAMVHRVLHLRCSGGDWSVPSVVRLEWYGSEEAKLSSRDSSRSLARENIRIFLCAEQDASRVKHVHLLL